jgi:hypothetical protein
MPDSFGLEINKNIYTILRIANIVLFGVFQVYYLLFVELLSEMQEMIDNRKIEIL